MPCLLAAALVLMLGAGAAEAQEAALVSNTSNLAVGETGPSYNAIPFTTGSVGATISKIKIRSATGNSTGTMSVRLRKNDTSNEPGDLVATFTAPSSLSASALNTFTAPANTKVDAKTKYWVTIHEGIPTDTTRMHVRKANNNQTGLAGWTIDNRYLWRNVDSGTWREHPASLGMSVEGTLDSPTPPAAPTVKAASTTSLSVSWSAPNNLGAAMAITDYDLRYFAGASDPADEADWIEEGETNGPPDPGSATSATITGLTEGTAYRVQVRAFGEMESPWSASKSGTPREPAPVITGAEITSSPAFGDTYRRNENIEVTVTWDKDVTWDVSATNARIRVRLAIGSNNRTAALVTGGETSGTARSLVFRYAVVQADTDADGVAVTTTMGGDLVILVNNATLQDSAGTAAGRAQAGLAADADHKVDGSMVTSAPAAPAAPTVAASSKTALSVSWSAPTSLGSASSITDYDLRYFAGTADPTNEADWIEEGEMGGPPDPGTGTSARITGLTKDTAYRVQVRAMGELESPWSASASGTPVNQAPRALEANADNTACVVKTDTNTARAVLNAPPGTSVSFEPMSDRASGDTGEFPAICATTSHTSYPVFDDPDGDELTYAVSFTPADNVTFVDTTPTVAFNRLWVTMYVALRNTDQRVDVTATDPDGLTATTFFLFRQEISTGTSAPAFSDTVSARTYTVNQQITELQLPAASGGDREMRNGEPVFGYFYKVDGLPAGLSFDAEERKITGTPTTIAGATTVTYTANDDDGTTTNDEASLTFTVTVEATDSTAPAFQSAAVDTSTLTMTWDENLDTSSVPAKTAFTVKVGGNVVDLADTGAVAVSGQTVTLTLASPVTSISEVTVSYTTPTGTGAMPLQDGAGNDVADLTDKAVTNNTTFPGICDRTSQVETALLSAVGKADCMAVTETDLAGIGDTLNLRSLGIGTLLSGDFSGLTALTTLQLNDNALSTLSAGVFDGLTALTTLRLEGNGLNSLDSDAFDELTALTTLRLEDNNLGTLPSDIFDDLTALTTLRLEDNGLNSLPADVFDGPTALTTLYVDGNSLGTLPSDIFDGPTALTTLSLSGNSLSSLPSDIFDGPTALTTLYLDGNSLSSLPAGLFDGLTALTTLYLDGNSLSSLPAGLFDGLTALETLSLSSNPGAPFPLAVGLERTDGAPEAASPATIKLTVREGAPHALTVPLDVTDGTGPASASVAAGALESGTFTVTKGSEQRSQVTLGTLPSAASGFTGIRYAAADDLPLTLFDMTAPALESASVNGATLTLTYDEALDEDSQPAGSAFTVKGAGDDQNPTEVSVEGMTVALTLERAAAHGDTVTATYTVPSADPIQDTSGNDAAGFEDEEVTNATPDPSAGGGGAAQPPEEGEVSGSGETVTLTFTEELDETSVPAPSDFTVTLAAASSASSASSGSSVASPQTEDHRVTEVSVEGKALELTISPPVPAGREAVVTYTPGTTPLRTAAGARVGEFTTTVAGSDGPSPPSAPRAPSVEAASPGSLAVSWSAPRNDGPAIEGYDLDYRPAGGNWRSWEHAGTATSATVSGLEPDTEYEVRVRARNAAGAGRWSPAGRGRTQAAGSAPVAYAGPDREADPGERVTLDGSGSTDADGDPLTFAWTQTAGVRVTLEGADTASPSFTAPEEPAVLTFSLVVSDEFTDSEADEVTVTVLDLAPSFDGVRIGTRRYPLGQAIQPWTLPEASGGNGELTYSLKPLPDGLRFDDSSRRLSGTPTAEGRFTLTYAAEDEDGDRAALQFAVRVFSNRPPRADAGEDAEADPGERVTLDGSGSSDPDGDPLTWEWLQTGGEVVTLEEPLAAQTAFTAPQQPGTLSFSLTVKDGEFTSEPDDVSVRVRDLAPSFGGATIDRPSLVQGETISPLVLPEASGGNGALTYSLTSTPSGLAGLAFDPVSRTLSGTPAAIGSYTFTYRVEDADANRGDGDAAMIIFHLTVERPTAARREVLKPTLAAVGTATLNSAVDTIGSRFNGAGGQASQLTLGGLRLAGGMGRSRPGIGGMMPGGGMSPGGGMLPGGGLAPGGGLSPDGGLSFGGGPLAGGGPGAGPSGLWNDGDRLLLGSSFEWSLAGSAQEDAGDEAASGARPLRWSLWGRAGAVSFDGRPGEGSRYGGELRTGYVGIDVDADKWLAGVALARSWSDSDYSFGGGEADFERGRLETTLTAVLPYGRWKLSEKSEAWGVLGMGRGEAAHVAGDALDHRETSDLSMWMAAGGLRHELASRRGYDLALRADGGLARLETADGAQDVDGLDAGSWRARVGLEASRGFQVGENLLTPFLELAARYDGGDAVSGAGLELAGGARYGAARFQLEARGRMLALHSDSSYREKGLSLTALMNPREDGSGFSLALGPRWGAGTGGAETLWQDHMPRARSGGRAPEAGMEAALGYGLPMLPRLGGVLTPFAEARFAGGVRQYRLGARFGIAPVGLDAELAAERSESAFNPPDDRFGFLLRWSFGGRQRGPDLPGAPGTDSEEPGRR